MAWPDEYPCPDCGKIMGRPVRVWGCVCADSACRCRALDAIWCQRCRDATEFPVRYAPLYSDDELHAALDQNQEWNPDMVKNAVRDLHEKRRAYCRRCYHETFFLTYTDVDIICRLCGVTGPRGSTLAHVLRT